jgi:hypothetical protein
MGTIVRVLPRWALRGVATEVLLVLAERAWEVARMETHLALRREMHEGEGTKEKG